jgi:hypothetical protein
MTDEYSLATDINRLAKHVTDEAQKETVPFAEKVKALQVLSQLHTALNREASPDSGKPPQSKMQQLRDRIRVVSGSAEQEDE